MSNETKLQNYNGYANRATWNLSLWVGNDENLYRRACEAVDKVGSRGKITDKWTKAFFSVELENRFGTNETPDGYSTDDPDIDWTELATVLRELADC